MSRVAKKPVPLPKGVSCTLGPTSVEVQGPKGKLSVPRPPGVGAEIDTAKGEVRVTTEGGPAKMAGTLRALLANAVVGVSKGYERKLELVGVGFRAAMQGKDLSLTLGYSHPIVYVAPEGVTLATPTQTEVLISGSDRQRVGEAAAKIRAFRAPEPYKGKGVKYAGEKITLKEAKKA